VKEVSFTNHLAEKAPWGITLQQKVAMRFRTLQGAKVLARLQAAVKMNAIGKQAENKE
jgi:hypothetical protein